MPSKQVPYTAAVARAVEDDDKRTILVFINMSGAQTAYINDQSTVSATQGIEIRPHANIIMEKALGWNTEKGWHCMGTGAGNLNIYEGFGKLPSPGNGAPGNGAPPGQCPTQKDESEGIPPPPTTMDRRS